MNEQCATYYSSLYIDLLFNQRFFCCYISYGNNHSMLLVHNNLVPRVFKPGVLKTLGTRLGSQKQGGCTIKRAMEDFSALSISFEINCFYALRK